MKKIETMDITTKKHGIALALDIFVDQGFSPCTVAKNFQPHNSSSRLDMQGFAQGIQRSAENFVGWRTRARRDFLFPNSNLHAAQHFSTRNKNPYRILGVPHTASFRTVQKAFVKLAFQHHPDTSKNENDVISNSNGTISKDFIRIREAFERIRDAKQSGKSLKTLDEAEEGPTTPKSQSWTDIDFLNYFHRQTGVRLNSDQREELVNLYRNRVKGGSYGGPSWDLARRLVAEQEMFLRNMQGGGPSKRRNTGVDSPFQLGRADAETSPASNLRRKRRR